MSSATPNTVLIHFLERWLEPNFLEEKPVLVSTTTENSLPDSSLELIQNKIPATKVDMNPKS